MRNLPFIVVLAFALALIAGGVIGVLAAPRLHPGLKQAANPPPPPPRHHGGPDRVPLGKELSLNSEQEQRMREIWEATRAEIDEHMRRRQQVERDWEAAVQGMFTGEQKARFDQLRQEYQARLAAVEGEFESIFRRADDKTRQILDDGQRKKFEDILVERRSRFKGPGGPGGPGPGPGHPHGPGPDRGRGPDRGPGGPPPPGMGSPPGPGRGSGGGRELRIRLKDRGPESRGPDSRPAASPATRDN